MPVGTNTGITDSVLFDSQNGAEKGITSVLAMLSGSTIFGHQGIVGADQGASLQQLIIDNEMIGYIKRIKEGLSINDDKFYYEEIKEIGIGGNFLTSKSTLENFKKEVWKPEIFLRKNWESIEKIDTNLVQRSKKKGIRSKNCIKIRSRF